MWSLIIQPDVDFETDRRVVFSDGTMVKITTNLLHGSIVGNQFTLTQQEAQQKDEPDVI